ncbi:MAG: Nif11-like leader peptide family natural product precursor [Betaproteobacteria bacterium]
MSEQSLQSFREKLNGNAQLEADVRGCLTGPAGGLNIDALAALGQRHGFDFTADEVRTAMAAANDELSDFELEVVSAGIGGGGNGGKGWGSN